MKIEENKTYTKEQLINCGWKFYYGEGLCEIWEQAKEILVYEPKEGKILGIFQKGGKRG